MADTGLFAGVSVETLSVIFAAGLVWFSAIVQHFANLALRGSGYVAGDRSEPPDMKGFFGRATRTLANSIESAVMFVPAMLAVIVLGKATSFSHTAATVYMAARSIFALAYWLRIPVIRSLAWGTGMICCVVLYMIAVD